MEDQVTVRLPADLGQALRRASRRLRRKNSDIVRLALQAFLQVGEPGADPAAQRGGGGVGRVGGELLKFEDARVLGGVDLLQPGPGSTELGVNDQLARDEHIQ